MMTETTIKTDSITPLKNGDKLTRFQFERRYEAMPDLKKAELIEGIVYLSYNSKMIYAKSRAKLIALIAIYGAATSKTRVACHGTLIFDDANEVQPDAVLFVNEDCGGKAFINDEDYLQGSPELIAEITASSVSYDSQQKKRIYEKNDVQEYIVWRVLDNEIDWFALDETGKYAALERDESGIIESKVFKGLRLNIKALLDNDLQKVMSDLQNGIASKEHTIFVDNLSENRKTT